MKSSAARWSTAPGTAGAVAILGAVVLTLGPLLDRVALRLLQLSYFAHFAANGPRSSDLSFLRRRRQRLIDRSRQPSFPRNPTAAGSLVDLP